MVKGGLFKKILNGYAKRLDQWDEAYRRLGLYLQPL